MKVCSNCGKRCADAMFKCPQCGAMLNENNQTVSYVPPAVNYNTYNIKKKKTGKYIIILVCVLFVFAVAGRMGYDYLIQNVFVKAIDSEKIKTDVPGYDPNLQMKNMKIKDVKINSEKEIDSEHKKLEVSITSEAKTVRYKSEYELLYVKAYSKNDSWKMKDCEVKKAVYSIKKKPTAKRIKSDIKNRDNNSSLSSLQLDEGSISGVKIKTIKKSVDLLKESPDSDYNDFYDDYVDSINNTDGKISVESTVNAKKTDGCAVYNCVIKINYIVDFANDRWISYGSSEDIANVKWNIKGKWSVDNDELAGWVKIYQVKDDRIQLEYHFEYDSDWDYDFDTDTYKKIIEKSSGKVWVKAEQNIALNGSSIYIEPDNCEYAIRVFSSDTDNSKGSITYKEQELVKE